MVILACNNDPDVCCVQLDQMELLKGKWNLESASNEDVDRTSEWIGFTITFNMDKSFAVENSADYDIWPQTGTFEFAGTEGAGQDVIIRSDNQQVYIDTLTDKELHLSIDVGAKDQWVFKLKK